MDVFIYLMHACIYACMRSSKYVIYVVSLLYLFMYACMCVCVDVCIHVRMHECNVFMYVFFRVPVGVYVVRII